jgi:AAA domain
MSSEDCYAFVVILQWKESKEYRIGWTKHVSIFLGSDGTRFRVFLEKEVIGLCSLFLRHPKETSVKEALVKQAEKKVEVLREVVVPKIFYSRVLTGVRVLDEIFGGSDMPGVMAGANILVTGTAGAGKSTMALQLADLFQRNAGRVVLYNVGEEDRRIIKMRADRIGLGQDFSISQIETVDELLKYCKKNGVEVLVQDSIQMLRDPGIDNWAKALISIVEKFQRFSKDEGVIIVMVGHVTKGGTFAGPQRIKHDCDAHAHLKFNKETGNRILELEKNRFGPAMVPYEFMLSASGLDFHQLPVEQGNDKGGPSRGQTRRDEIRAAIKVQLLSGEKISGYCYQRLGIDCSGGYWRGMIEQVKKQLQGEGYVMGEARSGPSGKNRAHVYVVSAPKDEEEPSEPKVYDLSEEEGEP